MPAINVLLYCPVATTSWNFEFENTYSYAMVWCLKSSIVIKNCQHLSLTTSLQNMVAHWLNSSSSCQPLKVLNNLKCPKLWEKILNKNLCCLFSFHSYLQHLVVVFFFALRSNTKSSKNLWVCSAAVAFINFS